MKKAWSYICMFFVGAFAAMVMVFYSRKPQTVINAETYIQEQKQTIGKIKQKGSGNNQKVKASQEFNKKEFRRAKRVERKNKRHEPKDSE